jgi:hypothetical protein
MDKQTIIDELRRVAANLQATSLTQRQFKGLGQIALTTVNNTFDSWNEAVEAAGLTSNPMGPSPELHQQKYSDEDLLQEIIRLTKELGKKPTIAMMNAKARFSAKPYEKRWGSLANACQLA